MKKVLTAVSLLVLLASCQKEITDINAPVGTPATGSTNGTRLVRIVTRTGTDSIITSYAYNSANLLTRFVQSGVVGGMPITAELRFVRNASNIITASIVKSTEIFSQFGVDSVVVNHVYDAANARYKYSLSPVISFGGGTETDSTVYAYTAGKVSSIISYNNDGSGYVPESKVEYRYTATNLLEEKMYSYNPGTSAYELDEVDTYEYDAKTNPIQFVTDAAVTSINLFYSANNQTKQTVVQTGAPAAAVTTAYTYNSSGRPLTASTTSGGAVTSTSSYTYQ